MKTQIYEGQRVSVSDSITKTVSFNERHETIPYVTVTLEGALSEPGTNQQNLVAVVNDVNQTDVRIDFSTNFTGYLHIHAFSRVVG